MTTKRCPNPFLQNNFR